MTEESKNRGEKQEERRGKQKEKRTNDRGLQLQTETWKILNQAKVLLAAVTKETGMSLWHLAWQHGQRISPLTWQLPLLIFFLRWQKSNPCSHTALLCHTFLIFKGKTKVRNLSHSPILELRPPLDQLQLHGLFPSSPEHYLSWGCCCERHTPRCVLIFCITRNIKWW